MRALIRLAALILLVAFPTAPSHAACTLGSAVTATFAARSSYDVRTAAGTAQAVPTQLSCSSALVSLLATDYVRAQVTSAGAFRLRSPAGDGIGYRLSADAAGTYAFTQGGSVNYMDTTLLNALGLLGNYAFVPPMFVALTETPNLPAGTYTDTVIVNWSWQICRLLGVGNICVVQDQGSGTTTLTVTLTVSRDCRISAPALSFGTAPLASAFAPVAQAVAVDCTLGTSYSVAFTGGAGGSARPWRRMSDGAGNSLRYNIYRDDGTTIWDETNPQAGGTGTGAVTPGQMQAYRARIDPSQATPPAGNYTDTVSVVITF